MIVVYGITSSGKSQIAEDIAVTIAKNADKALFYMATMENTSAAAKERIAHHKALRAGKGFVTIEEMHKPSSHVKRLEGGVVLIECMSNLVANVFYERSKGQPVEDSVIYELAEDIFSEVKAIDDVAQTVVVTNNVFGEGKSSDKWCDQYMRLLALANIRLANYCNTFVEANLGISTLLKGDLNCQ